MAEFTYNPFLDDEEERLRIQNLNKGIQTQDLTSGTDVNTSGVDLSGSDLGELWEAQLGYQYDPILEASYRWFKYGDDTHDANFNPLTAMQGYEGHESSLVVARSKEEEDDIKRAIDENRNRRQTMSEHGFMANLTMGILDPINLITIPFAGAGFVTAGARSAGGFVARRALATGVGVGTIQTGLEVARGPFDPLQTWQESAMNIGMATLVGGVIGSAVSIPASRKINAVAKTIAVEAKLKKAMDETIIDDLVTLDKGDGIAKSERKLGTETDETIQASKKIIPATIKRLTKNIEERLAKIKKSPEGKAIFEEYQLTGEVSTYSIDRLNDSDRAMLVGDSKAGTGDLYHGTNEKTRYRTDEGEVKTTTIDNYVNKNGDLVIKQTPDDVRGMNQVGVSLTESLDTAISYTASKDKSFDGRRDPDSVGGDDAVVFKIKRKAVDLDKQKVESGNEILIEGDILIKKGDFEIIRFGKNATDNMPFPEIGVVNLMKSLQKQTDELNDITKESNLRLIENSRNNKDVVDGYRLADSWFTRNPFYVKFLATPYKTIVQGKYPQAVKMYMHDLVNDGGVANMFNKLGLSKGHSVYTMAAMRNGEWVSVMDKLMTMYGRHTNQGTKKFMDIAGGPKGFDEWVKNVNLKYLKNDKTLTDIEKEAFEELNSFWKTWQGRLEDTGLIGNKVYYQNKVLDNERVLKKVDEDLLTIEAGFVVRDGDDAPTFLKFQDELIKWHKELSVLNERAGQAGLTASQQKQAIRLREFIDNYEVPRWNPLDKAGKFQSWKSLVARKARIKKQNEDFRQQIEEMNSMPPTKDGDENMFSRFWDREAIDKNRPQLEKILYDWYEKNPKVWTFGEDGKWFQKELSPDPRDISDRAKNTVDEILGIANKDVTGAEVAYYGMGKSKHFKHRAIDIPNSLVYDFIVNDPIAVMKAYTTRVAPRYEYAKKHNNKNLDEILEDIDIVMYGEGHTKAEIDRARMNYQHMYDRVVGSVMRKDPSAWDVQMTKVMRDAAQLNYLGSAGFSTLPDLAKILMEHDMKTITSIMKDVYAGDKRIFLNAKEGRLGGEILDILTGSSHLRMTEELANNPFSKGFYDKYADKGKNAFYIANLLAPATRIFKQIDSMARTHTLVDLAVRKHKGSDYLAGKESDQSLRELSDFDRTYAARYNIDDKVAKEINELVENGTIEITGNGLYIGNTDKWPSHMNQTRDNFRASLNSGILNTVLMGTPADKPIIVDGVVFIPMRVAKSLGLAEDAVVRGYHRIESPLMGLPFQFMSYSFAAMNKITTGLATDQIRNRKTAIAMSMGLAYLSLQLKTDKYSWENMDWEDRIARSFDQSGLAALMSDMFYQSLAVSQALDGPDLGFGMIEKKGPKEEDAFGAVTTIGGAGVSITHDFFRKGVYEFVTGNFGEGSSHMIRNMPAVKLWFLKGWTNDLTKWIGAKDNAQDPMTTGRN